MPLRSLFIVFCAFFVVSCSTDFEVNEKWKEINIVYGLLDVNDSVQWIKVNKAFLNENTNALEIAKIEDSIYHQDSIKVMFFVYENGQLKDSVQLLKTYRNDKDSGVFSSPGSYLYRTPVGYKINPDYVYVLNVSNPKTGVTCSANTSVVDNMQPIYPDTSTKKISFTKNQKFPVTWNTGKGAKFYDYTIRIHYSEFDDATGKKLGSKTLDWPIFKYKTTPTAGNKEMSVLLDGTEFFNFMADHITVNPNIYRTFDDLQFIVAAGGEEIYNYIQVNTPSIGIVQKVPEYTNIKNGYGIFSSRASTTLTMTLADKSFETLQLDTLTRELNFRK